MQEDRESRPNPRGARDPERAAVHLDELPDDGQPHAAPSVPAHLRGVDLGEFVDERRHLIGGDVVSAVVDRDGDTLTGGAGMGGDHDSAVIGDPDRVADEVDEDLAQPERIGDHRWEIRGDLCDELQPLGFGTFGKLKPDRPDEGQQIDRLRLQIQPLDLDDCYEASIPYIALSSRGRAPVDHGDTLERGRPKPGYSGQRGDIRSPGRPGRGPSYGQSRPGRRGRIIFRLPTDPKRSGRN